MNRKSFLLRIDPALWAELERAASADLRSINGEIEYLLREALRNRGRSVRTDSRQSEGMIGNHDAERQERHDESD